MDESEKRRERLKAMRMEASQAEASTTADTSAPPVCLANPLVDDAYSNQPVQDNLLPAPRFDFYTDPVGAFSGNRRNTTSNRPLGGYNPTPNWNPGRPQFQTNYSPNQMVHHTPSPIYGSGCYRSPSPMAGPSPSYQGTPPGYTQSSNVSTGGNFPRPGFEQLNSPTFSPRQGRDQWHDQRPMACPSPSYQGTPPGYNQSSNVSTGGNFPRPGFEQLNSPTFSPRQGRDQWHDQRPSPGPNPARGRGQSFGNNIRPGSGRGGGRGRGRGSHDYVSAKEFPHLFYCKTMLEDPWKFLEPVVPTVIHLKYSESPESWLPKSITTKKPRVAETSAGQASSQFSLAEYLASSYSEAITDTENAS